MKKGFTLMELLITIALLGIIGTVIVSNMGRTMETEQRKQIELFKNRLEKSACVYADVNDGMVRGRGYVLASELITQGLIKEEELYNPETQTRIATDKQIKVTFNTDGTKECCFDSTDSRCVQH